MFKNQLSFNRVTSQRYSSFVLRFCLLLLTVVVTSATYLQLFFGSFHGLDISDEGMYLLSADRPTRSSAFHNPFGDFTNLLFKLSFHQVWLFRISGVLILGFSGALTALAIIRLIDVEEGSIFERTFAICVGASVAPFYYAIGLFSPSYNWLNLVAICLGLAAILNISNPKVITLKRRLITWSCVLSLSIWIGSFAKISTGPGISLMFGVLFFISRPSKKTLTSVVTTVVMSMVALLVAHHFFIDSLPQVVEKTKRGQSALQILDPRYDFSYAFHDYLNGSKQWFSKVVNEMSPLILISLATFATTMLIKRTSKFISIRPFVSAVSVLVLAISFAITVRNSMWTGNLLHYNTQMWATTSIVACAFCVFILSWGSENFDVSKNTFLIPLILLGGVTLYAFGSNNGFINQITGASGLFALIAFAILFALKNQRSAFYSVALIIAVGGYLTTTSQKSNPYRQVPQSQMNTRIEIRRGNGPLFVDKRLAGNIENLRLQLLRSQWKPQTPLLDFTQYSAGVVFAIDAKPPVTIIPTVGGMMNVDVLAIWTFDYIAHNQKDNEWTNSWLLLPNPDNGLECILCPDVSVLTRLGRKFSTDYVLIAESQDFRIYKPRTNK